MFIIAVIPLGQDGLSQPLDQGAIVTAMPEGKIWTTDELLAMTPNERHDVVNAGIVTDVRAVPPDLLERARSDIRAHIADDEAAPTTET